MSMSANGQYITCDGEGCTARAPVPVALRASLDTSSPNAIPPVAGWLFVVRGCGLRHYCPKCNRIYLGTLSSGGSYNGTKTTSQQVLLDARTVTEELSEDI